MTRIGYILKRFPRVSETFIAQEILGLERHGLEVVVFALRPTDSGIKHAWLAEIAAPIHTFESGSFSKTWRDLQVRARATKAGRKAAHEAILSAFDHPTRSGRRYLEEACWIEVLANELEVEHFHAHFANHPAFVAMLAHQLSGKGFSFTAHAKDIYCDPPSIDLWRQQVQQAAFAVTVSRGNRRYLEDILGSTLAAKIETVHNGVDTQRIRPLQPRTGVDTGTILCVSRLVEKKGVDVLVEAAPDIVSRHPEASIVIAGEGELGPSLERRVADLGLTDRVQFLGGLPHDEVIELMSRSQVFVLPCRIASDGDRDALPTVLLEAMASGLACISTPVNGIPEIILQGRTGLIVPENDPHSLTAAISEVLCNPERRRQMGRAGRRRAEQRFDLAQSTGRLAGLFESRHQLAVEAEVGHVSMTTAAQGI